MDTITVDCLKDILMNGTIKDEPIFLQIVSRKNYDAYSEVELSDTITKSHPVFLEPTASSALPLFSIIKVKKYTAPRDKNSNGLLERFSIELSKVKMVQKCNSILGNPLYLDEQEKKSEKDETYVDNNLHSLAALQQNSPDELNTKKTIKIDSTHDIQIQKNVEQQRDVSPQVNQQQESSEEPKLTKAQQLLIFYNRDLAKLRRKKSEIMETHKPIVDEMDEYEKEKSALNERIVTTQSQVQKLRENLQNINSKIEGVEKEIEICNQ